MEAIDTHRGRIAAALAGALAAERARSSPGTALEMLAVAESLASTGSFEVDDLRRRGLTGPPADGPVGLLVRVLPFGLSTPLDRPRLRRDAYRCAAAAGADEGTTVACIGAALVIADLLRFDPAMTAIRVRQSLLEDAPMALLDRLTLLDAALPHDAPADDPGAAIQLALSVQASVGEAGVASVLAALGDAGRHVVGTLAGAFAGARTGACDVPLDAALEERVTAAAGSLAGLTTATPG